MGIVPAAEADIDQIGLMMTGQDSTKNGKRSTETEQV